MQKIGKIFFSSRKNLSVGKTDKVKEFLCARFGKNNIIKEKIIIFFINYLIIILLMKKTKNSYKKSGVNIETADKFTNYIRKSSKQAFKKKLNKIK